MQKKYWTFILFLVLVSIWSIFFSTTKFFLWWDLKETLNVSLQTIAWYLSLWWVISYLIWWALASTFLKKYLLFTLSFLSLIFVTIWYIDWIDSNFYLWFIMIFIGAFYWAWSVVKNVIISIEIKKTGMPDTKVNALVSIVFIVSIIFGSIFWGLLFENMANAWYLVIISMLVVSSILSLFLDYDKVTFKSLISNWLKPYVFERKMKFTNSMKSYLPELKYIFKQYGLIIISASFLWAISTIVSQKAVEYSMVIFNKVESEASFVLLYSALWAIIWSLISIKMEKYRWQYFILTNFIFWVLIILFPFFSKSYLEISVFAFIIALFFWISSNLIDSYFFRILWEENKKEYGSSTYWLILSIIIFSMMFLSNFIQKYSWYTFVNQYSSYGFTSIGIWYDFLMIFLWTIVLLVTYIIYVNKLKKWD